MQKCLPVAVSTMARTRRSALADSNISRMRTRWSPVIALPLSGRFSVIVSTLPSSCSRRSASGASDPSDASASVIVR